MENWRFLENNADYMISDHGRIMSFKNKKRTIHKTKYKSGYEYAWLQHKGIVTCHLLHRLVAQTFLPNPKALPEVNHLDGNPFNNHASNLEWCDHYHNMQHALMNGLMNFRPKPCGVVENGVIVRKYPSMAALARSEGYYLNKLAAQIRFPETISRPYNVVLLIDN